MEEKLNKLQSPTNLITIDEKLDLIMNFMDVLRLQLDQFSLRIKNSPKFIKRISNDADKARLIKAIPNEQITEQFPHAQISIVHPQKQSNFDHIELSCNFDSNSKELESQVIVKPSNAQENIFPIKIQNYSQFLDSTLQLQSPNSFESNKTSNILGRIVYLIVFEKIFEKDSGLSSNWRSNIELRFKRKER